MCFFLEKFQKFLEVRQSFTVSPLFMIEAAGVIDKLEIIWLCAEC